MTTSREISKIQKVSAAEEELSLFQRLRHSLGPILPGLLIDLVDLLTLGPVGLAFGMIAGGAAGYWIGKQYGLPRDKRIKGCIIAGLYCAMPFTGFLPMGTIIGAYVRFHQKDPASGEIPRDGF